MAKRKLTKKKRDFLEAYANKALNVSAACKAVNISRFAFYNWCNNDEEFSRMVEEEKEAFKDNVQSAGVKKIQEGDTTMIIFYHKTLLKDRGFIEKQEVEHSGEVKGYVNVSPDDWDNA